MDISGTYGPPRTQVETLWEEIKQARRLLFRARHTLGRLTSIYTEKRLEQEAIIKDITNYLHDYYLGE